MNSKHGSPWFASVSAFTLIVLTLSVNKISGLLLFLWRFGPVVAVTHFLAADRFALPADLCGSAVTFFLACTTACSTRGFSSESLASLAKAQKVSAPARSGAQPNGR